MTNPNRKWSSWNQEFHMPRWSDVEPRNCLCRESRLHVMSKIIIDSLVPFRITTRHTEKTLVTLTICTICTLISGHWIISGDRVGWTLSRFDLTAANPARWVQQSLLFIQQTSTHRIDQLVRQSVHKICAVSGFSWSDFCDFRVSLTVPSIYRAFLKEWICLAQIHRRHNSTSISRFVTHIPHQYTRTPSFCSYCQTGSERSRW